MMLSKNLACRVLLSPRSCSDRKDASFKYGSISSTKSGKSTSTEGRAERCHWSLQSIAVLPGRPHSGCLGCLNVGTVQGGVSMCSEIEIFLL